MDTTTGLIDITFDNINRCYAGFSAIQINEYWIEGKGWTPVDEEVKARGKYEDQLLFLLAKGCTSVNLGLTFPDGKYSSPDYKMKELLITYKSKL